MAMGILPAVINGGGFGSGTGSVTGALTNLSDVSISSPQVGQVLTYLNDGDWHNTNLRDNPDYIALQAQIPSTASFATTASLQAEIFNRQISDQNLQQQINNIAAGSHVVFSEIVTGNGITNQFQLTGNISNGQFISGGWNAVNVLNSLESDVTDLNGKPIYDGGIMSMFTRHRIYVDNISPLGLTTLDYVPLNNQVFKVWYWYNLQSNDRLDNYYRDDFVSKMEQSDGDLATNIIANVANFNGILSPIENTVQKALDKLDDHIHPEIVTLTSQVNTISASQVTLSTNIISISGQVNNINSLIPTFVTTNTVQTIIGSKNFAITPTVSGAFEVLHKGNSSFEWYQSTPSTLWEINHNLSKKPSVTTTTTAGNEMIGTVSYINNGSITVRFAIPQIGYAYLN